MIKNIYGEPFNMVRINNSFNTENSTGKKKPLALYIAIFIGIFILLNIIAVGLLFFR
ncbi:MAG: hypothetical protein J0M18_08505 [Ignavibacteria bacterium]|nr:hypothetical protein [Ignavibacteria bacterium]